MSGHLCRALIEFGLRYTWFPCGFHLAEMNDREMQWMIMVVGLRPTDKPLCYSPSLPGLGGVSKVLKKKKKRQTDYLFYLKLSALEKQRTVLPLWGRSVVSAASKCCIVCIIAARIKEKSLHGSQTRGKSQSS